MMETYEAFAAGKLTAKDDLIRTIFETAHNRALPPVQAIAEIRTLLDEAARGSAAYRTGFDVEVE